MAIKDRIVTDNFTIEYCKFGRGEKTFVIIPGISFKSVVSLADSVESQYKEFSNDYTVYLFDRKLNIDKDYSVYEMAEDTAIAMKKLGLKNTYIFGASQGGMIAEYIAIHFPDLVKKVALVSTVSKANDVFNKSIDNWTYLSSNNKKEELIEYFIDNVFSPSTLEKFRDYLISQNKDITNDDINRFYYLSKANKDFDVYDDLSKIQCPILAIGGRLDKVLSVNGTIEICDKTKCKSFIYENFGHALYDEAPDFRHKLLEFFSE